MSYSLERKLQENKTTLHRLQECKKRLSDLLDDDVGRMGLYQIEYNKCCQAIQELKSDIEDSQQTLDSDMVDIMIENYDEIQESNGFGQFYEIDKQEETNQSIKIKTIPEKNLDNIDLLEYQIQKKLVGYPKFYKRLGSALFLVSSISWFCIF